MAIYREIYKLNGNKMDLDISGKVNESQYQSQNKNKNVNVNISNKYLKQTI
jgi:hypothetical protein